MKYVQVYVDFSSSSSDSQLLSVAVIQVCFPVSLRAYFITLLKSEIFNIFSDNLKSIIDYCVN